MNSTQFFFSLNGIHKRDVHFQVLSHQVTASCSRRGVNEVHPATIVIAIPPLVTRRGQGHWLPTVAEKQTTLSSHDWSHDHSNLSQLKSSSISSPGWRKLGRPGRPWDGNPSPAACKARAQNDMYFDHYSVSVCACACVRACVPV